MGKTIVVWSGEDWQDHIVLLARTHYGPGEFVQVPDKDRGDHGLEGFSRDGCLYQCYAAEEPCTPERLYEKQRDKITTDLGKFVAKQTELSRILGGVRIRKWILIVPHFDTKQLLAHIATKTAELRAMGLPCAADEFCVCVEDDGCFALEQGMLLKEGVGRLHIEAVPVVENEIKEWSDTNETLVDILDGKLTHLPLLSDDKRRLEFRSFLVKRYLEGQSILSSLHDSYPELFQDVSLCKNHREAQLLFECSTTSGQANETLNAALATFREQLLKNVGGIQAYTIDDLAMEAVVDWLLRCPLHFPASTQ